VFVCARARACVRVCVWGVGDDDVGSFIKVFPMAQGGNENQHDFIVLFV
jgi:hypothetical protein